MLTILLARGSLGGSSGSARQGKKRGSAHGNDGPELGEENLEDKPAPATGTKLGFDHVYVINLDRREDRRNTMGQMMKYLNVQYELFQATNETEVERAASPKSGDGEDAPAADIKYHTRPAERACMHSHMSVLKDIVIHGYQRTLILEDDVDMEADIKDRLGDLLPHVPSTWDLLYLGHCSKETFQRTEFHKNLYLARRPSCTHAYAISLEGAKLALTLLNDQWPNPKSPYDLFLINEIKENLLEAYSVEPPYIVQVRQDMPPGDVAPDTSIANQWLDRSALFELGIRPHMYELE
ncbi:hypothetical protein GQ54DRAFT_264971 [Martensiomyces pterosporus]|nr:hypothetical protein GQ54DRAFT_264971 [Martensiomyces pterosporus]